MSRFVCTGWLALLALAAQAATLEYLSLEDMAAKSTAIVRGHVVASSASYRGPLIYTRYTIAVSERWKGEASAQVEVAVPGGVVRGQRQEFSGAPQLSGNGEYLLFLWTGQNGLTQVIGLSQGVYQVQKDAQGELIASRAASTETMLDPQTGRLVNDQAVRIRLRDLRSRVRAAAGSGGTNR